MNNCNNYRKCAKCGKTRAEDMKVTYHRFPNPGTANLSKSRAWSKYCFPNEDWRSIHFLQSIHDKNKVLCGRHFKDDQFYDSERQKLSKFAIPESIGIEDVFDGNENVQAIKTRTSLTEKYKRVNIEEADVSEYRKIDDILTDAQNLNDEELISVQGEAHSVGEEEDTLYLEPKSEDEQDTQDEQYVDEVGGFADYLKYEPETQDSDSDVNMRDVKACRACLDTKGVLVKISVSCKRIFESACGISIAPNDGYPYYFCGECTAQIKKILAFRRKARRADFVLKEIMTVCNEVSSTDISAVDRKITNLVSSLGVWNPKNIFFYTCDKTTDDGDNQFLKQDVKYDNGIIRTDYSMNEDSGTSDKDNVEDHTDGRFDDTPAQSGFDSVDDIIERLGVDDTTSNTEEKEIDLNDVFKGLEEVNSEDEERKIEDEKEKEYRSLSRKQRLLKEREEKKKLKEERDRNKVTTLTCRSVGIKLANFKITLLAKEEQLKIHEAKYNTEPFKSSLFKCIICVKVFASVQLLIEHCEEHNQSSLFKCMICMKVFDSVKLLIEHCEEHNQMHGKYSCDICKLHLENDEDMAIHTSEKHLYRYTCKHCGRNIHDYNIAVHHKCPNKVKVERVETDNQLDHMFHLVPHTEDDMRASLEKSTGAMRCPECKLAFDKEITFKKHLAKHIKRASSTCQCDVCGIYFSNEGALSKHMSYMHQYQYQCKACDFEAPNRYRAVEHLDAHKGISICPYCQKTSKTEAGLQFHIRTAHYKETYNKICPVCGLCFRSYMLFYEHQLEKHKYIYIPHPPVEPNELTCLYCKIEFKTKRAYDTHLLLYEHEGAKDIPYACRPCRKVFDNEESRDVHVLRCKSNSVFPVSCSICGVEVKSGNDYYHHCKKAHPSCLVNHGGKLCEQCGKIISRNKFSSHLCRQKENLYECNICDTKFLTARSYGLHMIYKHTNYPFHCAICMEKFKRRIKAKEHILKVHTPVMPYTCSVCHRQFAVLKYLNEHASTFHGVDLKQEYKVKKKKRNIFIYPHMKLDVSSINKEKIGELTFDIRDYKDIVIDSINNEESYEKYFIFDPEIDKPDDTIDGIKQVTRKRRSRSEIPVKTKKKKPETLVIETGENLDIVEVDGKKYVTIDGVVYHVENTV